MLKVLFISSGNSKNGISPIIKNQGESLEEIINLTYFTIKGKGILGYLKTIPTLRKHIKKSEYDIVHVHYSLSAYIASLAGARPLIVSLMGSDVKSKSIFKFSIKFFNFFFWSKIIVKSEDMYNSLNLKNVEIIPNGVNFNKFKPIDKNTSLKKVGWSIRKKHILFAANPNRPEKNFKLAKDAFNLIKNPKVELHYLENTPNEMIPYYLNAADIVLLTSLWEGSPNVIKEAMACNTSIVSTNVGDVKKVISSTKGCYLAKSCPEEVSNCLLEALNFNSKTNGRDYIKNLDSSIVAKVIIDLYNSVIPYNKET